MAKKTLEAFDRALKLLGSREKSRAQLEAALIQRGHPPQEVQAAIARCATLGYLDDQRAGLALAQRLFAENRSNKEVQRRLEAKGFDPVIADAVPHDELASARRVLNQKRVGGVKAAKLLLARGFSEELVFTLVDVSHVGE